MESHTTGTTTDRGITERERQKKQEEQRQPTVVERRQEVRGPLPSDLILRPPGARPSNEGPPDDPYSDEVKLAVKQNGDQPRSAEMEIAPGVSVTLGIRAVYFNFGGLVGSVTVAHHAAAHSERA